MNLIMNLIYYLTIGGLYDLFVYKMADVLFQDLPYCEKYSKSIALTFICGLIGLFIAQTYLQTHITYKNIIASKGITIGSIILILYSVLGNWHTMNSEIKLIVIGISLSVVIWISYQYKKEDKSESKIVEQKKKN